MQHSKRKTIIKKIIGSRIFLFLACLALIGLALGVGRESYHRHQLSKEINSLEKEINKLDGRNQQLSNLVEYFSEESFLEKEARLKLNLKKPGERVIIFSQKASGENGQNNGIETEGDTESRFENWWKWWEYFFKTRE